MLNWGNYPKVTNQKIGSMSWQDSQIDFSSEASYLAHAMGRSYGDSCLNHTGLLLDTRPLNHFINFDSEKGLLTCEAGVTLAEILTLIVPQGWFLPVMPGTKYVSVGGAIANDIHGKNHHQQGTFGCHIESLVLLRSDNQSIICSAEENVDLFHATIAGLGLTGIILSATIRLQKLSSTMMTVENKVFNNIEQFFEIAQQAEDEYSYTAAWLDCQSQGKKLGRGVMMLADFCKDGEIVVQPENKKNMPFYLPGFVLNKASIKLFNHWYFNRYKSNQKQRQYFDRNFFPLDGIKHWNRIYGKHGFFQYQFVIPFANKTTVMQEILTIIAKSGQGSFLSVLKTFGEKASPGMLSFPMPGVTLALDFANHGDKTLSLLNELDKVVVRADGRVYPAKDARMSAQAFQCYYPNWQEFTKFIDLKFNSDFWRRVTNGA